MPAVAGRATPMAVPAAHHTALDLFDEPGRAVSAPRELGHIGALAGHVVELEDAKVGHAAVDAARRQQHRVGEVQIPAFAWEPRARHRAPVSLGPAPPSTPGRAAPVTVHAHHFTCRELALQCPWRRTLGDHPADVVSLCSHVIELQDYRILLPTVEAVMRREVAEDELLRGDLPSLSRLMRLGPVQVAPSLEVRTEALPAPPLVPVPKAIEGCEREVPGAHRAPPGRLWLGGASGRFDARRRQRPDRPLDVAHPDAHGAERDVELDRDLAERPARCTKAAGLSALPVLSGRHGERMFASTSDGPGALLAHSAKHHTRLGCVGSP